MASFYKRGETWSFSIDIGFDKDGKRLKKGVGGFVKRKDAVDAAAELTLELSKGTYVQEKDITFTNFAKDWIKMYSADSKGSSTQIRQSGIKRLQVYFNEKTKIKDITRKQYQDILNDFQKKEYARNTIISTHATAKMLFKKAIELNIIKLDPTQYSKIPRKKETLDELENVNEVPKYLEKEELATFLQTAHDAGLNNDYTMFLLLAYTGIRGGELCALKWSDIDFNAHTIKITKTCYNPKSNIKSYELQTPKTKTSKRIIDVSERVINELELYKARQNVIKMRQRDIWHKVDDFIFTVNKYPGYPMYLNLVEIRMTRLLKIAKLPQELTPHSMRHTHTSLLAEAGVGLEEIMQRLGHANDTITKLVYLHVTKDMKKEASNKFDKLMDNL